MNYLIVADSSADLALRDKSNQGIAFASVPLKIITSVKEYVDDEDLDVEQMVKELEEYKGRSSSSCPNPSDWLDAFGEAKHIFCVTITSGLSGSCNSACRAKEEYEETYPDRKVFVIDSLSTGPEMHLIIEKLEQFILEGMDFATICEKIQRYQKHTGLLFMLESMKNLANNGRVSPIAAKLAGILGIRVIGKASDEGTLEQLEKARGEGKALTSIIEQMKKLGYAGGKVIIAHCINSGAAHKLKEQLKAQFKDANVDIHPCRALCSFYAERGGLLVGFEKQPV